ncbi:hypothetical protein, partial [Mesorhizobium sp. M1A.F.Ca.IN.020.06.1.1]|uniref:hypothetical protein n=1 Tax=Mesorhizobium sp. M1A.F.Ca.IN.020.06.1.1 TaxID=2496765 RepID=UPI0019D47832
DAGIRPDPSPQGKPPRQAGLCSRNRQNKVNAMLTIVINLTFTQIGLNRLAVNKKGGQVPREPLSQKLIFRRQQAVW